MTQPNRIRLSKLTLGLLAALATPPSSRKAPPPELAARSSVPTASPLRARK